MWVELERSTANVQTAPDLRISNCCNASEDIKILKIFSA